MLEWIYFGHGSPIYSYPYFCRIFFDWSCASFIIFYGAIQILVSQDNAHTNFTIQEGELDKIKKKTFASKNYPDFIIFKPYKIAIEYKKSSNGSVVKQAIGQSIMHTLCDEFEFVYCLFQDENKKKKILESVKNENEGMILKKLWDDYNVWMEFL